MEDTIGPERFFNTSVYETDRLDMLDKDKLLVAYYVDCSAMSADKAWRLLSEVKESCESMFDESVRTIVIPCPHGLEHNKIEVLSPQNLTENNIELLSKLCDKFDEYISEMKKDSDSNNSKKKWFSL